MRAVVSPELGGPPGSTGTGRPLLEPSTSIANRTYAFSTATSGALLIGHTLYGPDALVVVAAAATTAAAGPISRFGPSPTTARLLLGGQCCCRSAYRVLDSTYWYICQRDNVICLAVQCLEPKAGRDVIHSVENVEC